MANNAVNDTKKSWIDYILDIFNALPDVIDALIEAGIITPAEGSQAWTRAELAALVDARLAAAEKGWKDYLPWIVAGGLGIGLLIVVLRK
ncbi:MAG: hypothetical protein GH145_02375 [Firmicutes bacterium]|nr:hypothetical protein [Bacillota bacterium]